MTPPLLALDGLVKHFRPRRGLRWHRPRPLRAVDGVSLAVGPSETVAVVGESGCGKSTLARLALRLLDPDAGSIRLDGHEIAGVTQSDLRPIRRRIQAVFQDPAASLNPRLRIVDLIGEPIRNYEAIRRPALRERVAGLLGDVGLDAEHLDRFPHEISGGQRQRIGIARALALDPALLVLDEAVSALDVSIQAQILNLLMDLQDERRIAYLFIAHDLSVVEHFADRVAVMYLGRIVETAPVADLFAGALHPYTEALLAAAPTPDPARSGLTRRRLLKGDPPSPSAIPSGCRFRTRCPIAQPLCAERDPALLPVDDTRAVACHLRP
ncbi:MAG: ATP-binding cassette domain-containing protein [Azospirillaceae bacterium]